MGYAKPRKNIQELRTPHASSTLSALSPASRTCPDLVGVRVVDGHIVVALLAHHDVADKTRENGEKAEEASLAMLAAKFALERDSVHVRTLSLELIVRPYLIGRSAEIYSTLLCANSQ